MLFLSGKNHPTLKLLNKLVKKSITFKWYDLGIELLEPEDTHTLDEIEKNHPTDVSTCCTKMFRLWLDKQPEASWEQLIQALREPIIELNELANTVEQNLISINEGRCIQSVNYVRLDTQCSNNIRIIDGYCTLSDTLK